MFYVSVILVMFAVPADGAVGLVPAPDSVFIAVLFIHWIMPSQIISQIFCWGSSSPTLCLAVKSAKVVFTPVLANALVANTTPASPFAANTNPAMILSCISLSHDEKLSDGDGGAHFPVIYARNI
jgi:hypothetical protein